MAIIFILALIGSSRGVERVNSDDSVVELEVEPETPEDSGKKDKGGMPVWFPAMLILVLGIPIVLGIFISVWD